MAEFVMPALGADMSAGTLMAWHKAPGDRVSRGDVIAEVHTDKADIEVEVFTSGVIEKLLAEPGDKVPIGTPLAQIREDGKAGAPTPAPPPAPPPAAPVVRPVPPVAAARIHASPAAKALAEELGVDLERVTGTGPHGRIQRRDVQRAAAAAPAAVPAPPAAGGEEQRRTAMREAIATAMGRSKREIPHFYVGETIDLSASVRWLAEENLRRAVEDRLLPGVLLLKAVALALREVPELNATRQGDRVVTHASANVGVAIFLRGGGLVAPAIHGADERTLDDLMRALHDLVGRARAGRLRSSEVSEPTITVTALGERGAESVLPIIFPPQVAIVGFGRIVERPWVSAGQILPCPVVVATLAADHRVTDGRRASAFLAAVSRLLQEPESL